MVLLSVLKIRENEITNNLYSIDDFEQFVESIKRNGILEPIIVHKVNDYYEIISGNRRFRAAIKLGRNEVPVIIKTIPEMNELLIVDHQQQRIKKNSEIMNELRIIKEAFNIKRGSRSDLKEKAKRGKEKLNQLRTIHTKTKLDRLNRADTLINEIFEGNETMIEKEWKKIDNDALSRTVKRLQKMKEKIDNEKVIDENFEIHEPNFTVYKKSSSSLDEIKPESIQLIVCSPPYFLMRCYDNGENELGREATVEEYCADMADHFDDSKRVLKKNGTLWVNLGDYINGDGYSAAPERFLLNMIEKGWILHDKIKWIKNNPVFTHANRSVLADEVIYVFKKSKKVLYNPNWVKDYDLNGIKIDYGHVKLRSVFEFTGNTITTNVANK